MATYLLTSYNLEQGKMVTETVNIATLDGTGRVPMAQLPIMLATQSFAIAMSIALGGDEV